MSYEYGTQKDNYYSRWICADCGIKFVVPALARHCEQKHVIETATYNRTEAEERINSRGGKLSPT